MLNVLRRGAKTWLIKLLLLFLALTFAVWGVGNYLERKETLPVAKVGKWEITPEEFNTAYQQQFSRLQQMAGGQIDRQMAEQLGLKFQTLQALISQYLIFNTIQELRLTTSPETLREEIANLEGFQTDKKFDLVRYNTFLKSRRQTPREFENQMSQGMANAQLENTLQTPVAVPSMLLKHLFDLEREQRTIATLQLKPMALNAEFKADDDALTAFLKEHQEKFLSPRKARVSYIVLNTDSVRSAISVTAEEIQEYYQEHRSSYGQPPARHLRHILLPVDATSGGEQAVLEKALALAKGIAGGQSFEEVARKESRDVSAASGGLLGLVSPGSMPPEFEKVAFSLPLGQVSEPVRTEAGWHLIRVDTIREGKEKELKEVEAEIRAQLEERKGIDLVYEASTKIEDQLAASGDLQDVAKNANLRYKETGFIALGEASDTATSLEQNAKFLEAAFNTPVGEISPLIEAGDGVFFALQVKERLDAQPLSLEEARKDVLTQWLAARTREKGMSLMKQALELLQQGKSLEEAAKLHPAISVVRSDPFMEQSPTPTVPTPVRTAAFTLSMAKPLHEQVLDAGETLQIVRLEAIGKADPTQFEKARNKLEESLTGHLGQEYFGAFLKGLQKRTEIHVEQSVLDRL
ncbi:MAG: SurA N-terminal domain-containing protein [Magnetococcales bacterium]|nr:SurA N-terminal domain-containing protein [Magnetococcales bacterium]